MSEQHRIKLPKRELTKYGKDIRGWLAFWATKSSKKEFWSRQHAHKDIRPRSIVFGNSKRAERNHGLRGPVNAIKERDLTYLRFAEEKNKHSSHDTKKGREKDEVLTNKTQSLRVFRSGHHVSQECRKAFKLIYEEKIKKLIEEKQCFRSLRTGHPKKKCKAKVTCVEHVGFKSNVDHYPTSQQTPSQQLRGNEEQSSVFTWQTTNRPSMQHQADGHKMVNSSLNSTVDSNVCLETLLVKLRAIINGGSSQSYVLEDIAKQLGLQQVGRQDVTHELFGGRRNSDKHNLFEHDQLVLTVGGIVSKTDQVRIGYSRKIPTRASSGMIVTFMKVQEISITDFWALESIGVMHEGATRSKADLNNTVEEEFRSTIIRLQDGRYKLCLLWIRDKADINSNRRQTEKKLMELKEAKVRVLRYVQQSVGDAGLGFCVERMNVFKDSDGLLRLKSPFYNTKSEFDIRCPIILPGNNEVVKVLIRKVHKTALHVGVETVQHLLRHKFWVLKGKRAVRLVITFCILCRRSSAKKTIVECISIPEDRVRAVAPFQVAGVDVSARREKVWMVLYTCAVYRAVHLQFGHSLSTGGFLRSLQKFIAGRGRPATIYSDNGLNFVGCNNLFRHVTISRITWTCNPPTAAWWVEWWERLIGMMKTLFRSGLGNKTVDYEELLTWMFKAESVMNQRPLTHNEEAGGGVLPSSPAQFIQDNPIACLPKADLVEEKLLRLAQQVQVLRQELRARLRNEYLGFLRHYTPIGPTTDL
ncbi:hypothetical protein ILUMI_11474 [Ignelater luminosus]|uniref:Integrase zinc-binding domain-containing protein n=1 Tax=Ignelater luminosus TaxID=2038154 RepID=A0A8K0CW55_IGNLU|nr:hypothetical protein ILUMI_11474 [Ignelater luminosus]